VTTYKIALIGGDGTGPEVMSVAKNMLTTISELSKSKFELIEFDCGAGQYSKTGAAWEEGAFEFCRDEASAILLGAVGLPGITLKTGANAGSDVIFKLRFELDLYANVRPAKLYPTVKHMISDKHLQIWSPTKVDLVIIRENTEGLYAPVRGVLHRDGQDEIAIDTRIITRKGAKRIIDFAFNTAEHRSGAPGDGTKRVTCVDKSNVLAGCKIFRNVYDEVAEQYANTENDYAYVDAFTQWLIRTPEHFDVVVCSNMFGDILTDLAAVLQGGMGMAPSGNIGVNHAMFEPVHGSTPKYAGKNIINPTAMLLSVKMMLQWLGDTRNDTICEDAAIKLENSIIQTLEKSETLTPDLGGHSKCSQMGNAIQNEYENLN
jgi:3-isopropylmalate dehydrogenase